MKRFVIVAALAALAVAPVARAEETGSILIGDPLSGLAAGGVTELADACTPGGALEGIDGVWYTVSPGQEVTATLTGGATGLENLDVWFYDSTCGYIDSGAMATDAVSETGTAPATSAYMIVDLFTGAQATFTVS